MAKKHTNKPEENNNIDSDSKLFAVIGMIPLAGYLIVYFTRKNDYYAMYYSKQGLILFVAWVIAAVAGWLVSWIPIINNIASYVLNALILALFVIGIIYALSGEKKEVPIIGEYAKKI
jgi:uncharacterized membrane protein